MTIRTRLASVLIVLVAFVGGCSTPKRATVVWVSIDGLRHDYLQRFHPPTLSRLAKEGAYSTQVKPIFPSLTFPNHIAQATGARVDGHGVPANAWYDREDGQSYSFPDDGKAIRVEPIWTTAKRQGLRVATVNWPMSGSQTGPHAADVFVERYDSSQTDDDRLNRVISALNSHPEPFRLITSYMSRIDTVGHRQGPDSQQIHDAVLEADASIARFVDAIVAWFDRTHSKNDELYLLFTTDHGMEPIRERLVLPSLIGADLMQDVKTITSGPVGLIYLHDIPEAQRDERAKLILDKLGQNESLTVWKQSDIPQRLHFTDPTRMGDLVVLARPGVELSNRIPGTTRPATASKANHGYDPDVCPNMNGAAIVWRYRKSLGGVDLGPIDNTQWHATVAKLLGIQPSPAADARVINFSAKGK